MAALVHEPVLEDGTRPPRPRARTFLVEVEALRALAVMLVVLYHLWPLRLRGGYVGVDVFFVISGYLITSHLAREVGRTNTIRLGAFYARRARRLLPAALLVLLATLLLSRAFLPATRWASTAHDVVASALYFQNWSLAARAVDYSASADAASAVQHFWSLSVEEQFYVVWPPLILLLLLVGRRMLRGRADRLLLPGIVVLSAASLCYSVYATATDHAAAYFITPTRLWELGAGAILAVAARRRRQDDGAQPRTAAWCRIGLRWGGLGAIIASALCLTEATPFPGYLALLPVLGTVAVIAAGEPVRPDPLAPLIRMRPTQFVGGISYAVYLWHWPLVVVTPLALGHPLRTTDKVALLALSVVLAWLTKVLVEQPTRNLRFLVARPALTAVLTVAGMLVVYGAAHLQLREVDQQQAAAHARLVAMESGACFGAAAVAEDAPGCTDPYGPPLSATLPPDAAPWFADPACHTVPDPMEIDCDFGGANPKAVVALVGDSHASAWRAAVHRIAAQRHWRVIEILMGGCPATRTPVSAIYGVAVDVPACDNWRRHLNDVIAQRHFDAVLTSAYASEYTWVTPGHDPVRTAAQDFTATWQQWSASGARVYVLRDAPNTGRRNLPECVAANPTDPSACALRRSQALAPDALSLAGSHVSGSRISYVDLSNYFCDADTCYAVVGGVLVYMDPDHMSAQFSRSLAPYLAQAIGDVG